MLVVLWGCHTVPSIQEAPNKHYELDLRSWASPPSSVSVKTWEDATEHGQSFHFSGPPLTLPNTQLTSTTPKDSSLPLSLLRVLWMSVRPRILDLTKTFCPVDLILQMNLGSNNRANRWLYAWNCASDPHVPHLQSGDNIPYLDCTGVGRVNWKHVKRT